jgi:hypothetical protein
MKDHQALCFWWVTSLMKWLFSQLNYFKELREMVELCSKNPLWGRNLKSRCSAPAEMTQHFWDDWLSISGLNFESALCSSYLHCTVSDRQQHRAIEGQQNFVLKL